MFTLPRGFTTGEPLRWRRVPGLVLAEVDYEAGQRVHGETHARARFMLVVRGGIVYADSRLAREGTTTLFFQPAGELRSYRATGAGATCLILEKFDGARRQAALPEHVRPEGAC